MNTHINPQRSSFLQEVKTAVPRRSQRSRAPAQSGKFGILAVLFGVLLLGGGFQAQAQEGLVEVTPSMLSGNFSFFASPAITAFADPIPYGIVNNATDAGWIWSQSNDSELNVDFGSPVALTKFRVYSTYPGGARGARWAIQNSPDNVSWTQETEFLFETSVGGGVDDEGNPTADTSGWYETSFNENLIPHRYWQIKQIAPTIAHAPRCGQVEFHGYLGLGPVPYVRSTSPTGKAVRFNAPIVILLQDALTAVAPGTIQLFLNGEAVTPTITKPADTNITTLTYVPPAGLPQSTNRVRCIFGNNATPPVLQTNDFSFFVINDDAGALIINVDFKGVRNTDAGPQTPNPTYVGQGAPGGGTVWNGIVVDSRLAGTDNNYNLTISGSNLLHSVGVGGPTTVSFTISQVGGNAGGTATTNEAASAALLGDWIFNNTMGNYAGVSPFTIEGLGDVPNVDLYFYRLNGTVTIPGVNPSPLTPYSIFNDNNTLYLRGVPVTGGKVSGVLGKGTAIIAGFTIQKPAQRPFLISVAPTGGGISVTSSVIVKLQDYVTQVNGNSIQLSLNGQSVSPTVTKAAGITTVTYTPAAPLASGNYAARVVFADSSTPPIVQTNDFSFVVIPPVVNPPDLLPLTASMISGQQIFMATVAAYTSIKDPAPFGAANNVADAGWIWTLDSYFVVDFTSPAAVKTFRVFSSYPGGGRGADWSIEYSDDNESWYQETNFAFVTTEGGGVNEDGSPRTDFGGWYQTSFNASGQAHRYWRVYMTAATQGHSPRCATVQFLGRMLYPAVKSTAPTGGGHRRNSVIKVELQDNLTAVVPSSIQFQLNGQAVTPVINKPADTNLTTITYDAQGALPPGPNDVTLIYSDTSTPPFVQTNSFRFLVVRDDLLTITPDMLQGSTAFFATPFGANIGSPVPYGFANNAADSGWIWTDGNWFTVDFGAPATIKEFRAWVTFAGGARGAIWTIEYSNNNSTYTSLYEFYFESSIGGGVNDDGSMRDDWGGWYGAAFNDDNVAARYWRVRQTGVTLSHAPRAGQVEFYGTISGVIQRPTLVSAKRDLVNAGQVVVVFSEPVTAATAAVAANYAINNGVTVGAAAVGANASTVVLTTSPLTADQTYTLTVNGVQNLAGNAIVANSQIPVQIPLPPRLQDAGADGLVVIEAERYDNSLSAGGTTWTVTTEYPGFSGTGAMQPLPDTHRNVNIDLSASPRLDFVVNFLKAGTHYIWTRTLAPDLEGGRGESNSDNMGLDGVLQTTSSRIVFPETETNFVWSKTSADAPGIPLIEVPTAGLHVVNLWMREDGLVVDKIVLTTNPDYTPSGLGPADSRDISQGAADTFIAFEAETKVTLVNAPLTIWAVTNEVTASGASAIWAGGDNQTGFPSSFALYYLRFNTPGTYTVYFRWRADERITVSNNTGGNSFRLPVDFGDLPNDPTSTNFVPTASNAIVPASNVYVVTKDTQTYTVTQAQVDAGQSLLFKIGTRELGMFLDRFVFSTDSTLTEAAFNALPNSGAAAPARLNIALQGNSVVVSWTGAGTLQVAEKVTGPYEDMAGASPVTITASESSRFYRVRQ